MAKKKFYEHLQEHDIPVKRFFFTGSYNGKGDGFPRVTGHYHTVRYGTLEDFTGGDDVVGDWVRVFWSFSSGSAEWPDSLVTYYTNVDHVEQALRILEELKASGVYYADIPSVNERTERLRKHLLTTVENADAALLNKIVSCLA